jgi:hypothetical protein
MWERAYEEAGAARKETAAGGGRRRRVHLLTGLVLPVWEAVQTALGELHRASDRRLKVLRIQTTGARPFLALPLGALLPGVCVAVGFWQAW